MRGCLSLLDLPLDYFGWKWAYKGITSRVGYLLSELFLFLQFLNLYRRLNGGRIRPSGANGYQ